MNSQSGSGNCMSSSSIQSGGDYTQVLAKNHVPDNYSNYGLIPNTEGKSQYVPTNHDQSMQALEKNNGGVFYQVAAGKRSQKGGDSTMGATGMADRFFSNAPAGTSCDANMDKNMNVGHYDLVPHGPVCSGGAKKKKATKKTTPKKKSAPKKKATKKTTPKKKSAPKKKATKKTTPKKKSAPKKKATKKTTPKKKSVPKKVMKGGLGRISNSVTKPLKGVVNTWHELTDFVGDMEKRMLKFYDKMEAKNIPNYNPRQSGGAKMKNFEKYMNKLNQAMNEFQSDIHQINSQNGGNIKFNNGQNLDSPLTPNHPVQKSTTPEPVGYSNDLPMNASTHYKSGGAKKAPKKKTVYKKGSKVVQPKRSPRKKTLGTKKKTLSKKSTPDKILKKMNQSIKGKESKKKT